MSLSIKNSGDYMSNIVFAFTLSTLAGLSTLLGFLPLLFNLKDESSIILKSLAFASGVMLTVSIIDLIPESYNLLISIFKGFPALLLLLIFLVIGIIFSILIDKFLPNNNNKLFHLGIVSMLAIILHNIPEGISIAVPIYYATGSKKKAFLYTFISGISELFGAVIAYLFLAPYVNDYFKEMLNAIIAGIMVYLALTELLKTSLNYHKKKITWISFMIGCLFIYFNHILFH